MDRWRGKTVLVTGASSGIGAELTRTLSGYGMRVVACARNLERLQSLEKDLSGNAGKVIPIQCDVRKEDQILDMFQRIQKECGGVEVCVNNAGVGYPAKLYDGNTADWRDMMEVNVLGLSICTRETIQSIRKNKLPEGHIIHISSMSAYRLAGQYDHFYSGTKHAVRALTEGLRQEIRDAKDNIRVTSISPANVDTEFNERKFRGDEEMLRDNTSRFKELEAKDIVDAVVYALSAAPHAQIHDVLIRPLGQHD